MSSRMTLTVGADASIVNIEVDGMGIPRLTMVNEDLWVEFKKWLDGMNKNFLYSVISQIVIDYRVTAALEKESEEEQLQGEHMGDDELIQKVLNATGKATERSPDDKLYVEIKNIYAQLQAMDFDLPGYVVYTILKTFEHIDGRVYDVGEGFFYYKKPAKNDNATEQ